jgi:hypothetical protein
LEEVLESAMAKKRPRPRHPLGEPILRPDHLTVQLLKLGATAAARAAVDEEVALIIAEQKSLKLALLAEQFGINLAAPNGILELCLRLAEKHVQGFKVVDSPLPGPGRPKKHCDYFELVKEIEYAQANGETISEACRKLSRGKWKGRHPESLETRYHEWVKQYEQRRQQPDPQFDRLCRARALATEGEHDV